MREVSWPLSGVMIMFCSEQESPTEFFVTCLFTFLFHIGDIQDARSEVSPRTGGPFLVLDFPFCFVLFCFSVLNSAVDDTTFFGSRLPLRLSRGTCERLVLDTVRLFAQCELTCLGLCQRAELAISKATPGDEN